MCKRRIERIALTTCSLAACMALFGAMATGSAQARGAGSGGHALGAIRGLSAPTAVDAVPPMQPQFNPSFRYTVAPPPVMHVSPGSPGSVFGPRTGN
jgi:hypothetical protein